MHLRGLAVLAVCLFLMTACYGDEQNLTETGRGIPLVGVDFPSSTTAGATETLTVAISNPGPGDMRSVVVAFALVGPTGGAAEVPTPLIGIGRGKTNPAIAAVRPEPDAISPDAVLFVFGSLPEGGNLAVEFDVVVPSAIGVAANSVTVYDGDEPERAGGIRLQTTVQ
ncbi:MAG TPA: hypothetical protein VNC78_12110 [Actinomycetota bacterium]|nr:hypothetical protein [Actinomycetota bacterium]